MRKSLRWATTIGISALMALGIAHSAMAAGSADSVGGGPASYPADSASPIDSASPTDSASPAETAGPAGLRLCDPPSTSSMLTMLGTGRASTICKSGE